MAFSKPKTSQVLGQLSYLLVGLPFAFAFISWWGFPTLAEWLSLAVFGYKPLPQTTGLIWRIVVGFFYSWFTFLAIGIAGLLAIGAWISRQKTKVRKMEFYPMVSFVVPAFNEEKQLPQCIGSLFKCGAEYPGLVEIIVVDDGSTDRSYDIACVNVKLNAQRFAGIRGRVIRYMINLGKAEALRAGVNGALGQIIGIVDADSWWESDSLRMLVEYMKANGKAAVTGYVHPSDGEWEENPYIALQQLEYSQGLGIFRCAQALVNSVLVIPGAIGLFNAEVLRDLLNTERLQSVTEDFEVTLKLQKKGYKVGYLETGRCGTVAPRNFSSFWKQRSRWFVGWLHNTLEIHRDALLSRRWLGLLLVYILTFEYVGAFVELAAIISFPFLFWFAPDRILFILNMLWFGAYSLILGVALQAVALRFAYGDYNHKRLLYYTPFYVILRIINLWARVVGSVRYIFGFKGGWERRNR
ncbi:MAG: glycosyltransferase family 2 protein [Candidatus Bathyarchaeota archaeon]|nr:MAG: glycosyltransferase family 2 protein [Candidatus Bathyarchaeota archaeon]